MSLMQERETRLDATRKMGSFAVGPIQPGSAEDEGETSRRHHVHRMISDRGVGRAVGDDSDCSWTHEEDSGSFYIDMRQQFDDFIQASDQTTMTTKILSKRQRRFVHAFAQILGLGHASLGAQGKHRRMIIFKENDCSSGTLEHLLSQTQSTERSSVAEERALSPAQKIPRKRKRIQRLDAGFHCQFSGCHMVFNLACERTKHEQSHQLAFTNRYQCYLCEKGFRYPKDLRRHHAVHERSDSFGLVAGSDELPPPTLAQESRVSSETSLTFSNKTISQETSPLLVPLHGDESYDLTVEPLVLDMDSWASSHAVDVTGFERQVFGACCFEDIDDCDQGLLNMARPELIAEDIDDFDDGLLEMARLRK